MVYQSVWFRAFFKDFLGNSISCILSIQIYSKIYANYTCIWNKSRKKRTKNLKIINLVIEKRNNLNRLVLLCWFVCINLGKRGFSWGQNVISWGGHIGGLGGGHLAWFNNNYTIRSTFLLLTQISSVFPWAIRKWRNFASGAHQRTAQHQSGYHNHLNNRMAVYEKNHALHTTDQKYIFATHINSHRYMLLEFCTLLRSLLIASQKSFLLYSENMQWGVRTYAVFS
jgi:hypothetical protein